MRNLIHPFLFNLMFASLAHAADVKVENAWIRVPSIALFAKDRS